MNNFSLSAERSAALQRARSSNSNSIQSIDACRNIKKLFSSEASLSLYGEVHKPRECDTERED